MTAEVFFDTNILVYASSEPGESEQKRQRALALISYERFGTSAQVIQEFFVTVVRKGLQPISVQKALDHITQFLRFPCLPIDHKLVRLAIEQSARYQISYWDGAIIAAAQTLGCHTLYTEDLNDGQMYGNVHVKNPFR